GIAGLFLLALGMKAAAFPVNAWLPASYHTPDPTISALFGGLLTKVGVYAIIRILGQLLPANVARDWALIRGPNFAPFEFGVSLNLVIALIAGATLILAPLGAMAETNLRRAIGFLVIGGIGAMLAGVALGTSGGIFGAAIYALHSMLTITGLYLVAGLIERATGTTDTRRMGGLYQFSSPLSILFICLVFAVSGLPPFLGFWPKFVLVQAGLGGESYGLAAAILLNAFLTIVAGSRLWSHIFWRNGREGDGSEAPNPNLKPLQLKDRWWGLVPAATLTLAIVLLGLWPAPLFLAGSRAAAGIVDPTAYVDSVSPVGAP
ncbi:MAG: proton-conducting transporter membrane subunit, partial [Cucumibacter sp.]